VVSGGSLNMQAGSLTNTGTMDEEKAGKVTITGNLTNNGTLTTNNANLGGGANSLTVTGTLTNNASDTVTIGANNDTTDKASVATLTNAGTVTVGTGATLTLTKAGADSNTGTIAVNGALDIKAAATLSGTGTITLTNGAITGLGAGPVLTNSTTIQGSGTISNLGLVNSKTLLANQAAPLIILPTAAGLKNNGTLSVSTGDTMQIGTSAGGALVNFASNTLTGGTYNVSGTLQFGASGTTLATNAANITLTGAGAQMIDFGSNNMLAGFNNNATAGVFKLAGGAALTTTGGSFTNAGLFTVSAGTSFTVGGSSFNFTQTAGTTTVDGTLASSTLGTVAVNGGSLFGGGTVNDNVVDAGILSPGDSVAKTGQLKVADAYTQTSAGALDIAIGGTVVGTKYDQLKVTQGATLGGTLNVSLANAFTPTVGQTFTIVNAASVTGTFATVNGLSINGTEHFTITYSGTNVVLKVVSGALPASNLIVSQVVTPGILPVINHGSIAKGHFAPTVAAHRSVQAPAVAVTAGTVARPALGNGMGMGLGMRGFRPRDVAPGLASITDPAGTASSAGSFLGLAPVSASAYNSMAAMNHMRFECGVDLKALLKTGRKQFVKGLWAAPDSPNALSLGYMVFVGSR
jgi:hypothetical protein